MDIEVVRKLREHLINDHKVEAAVIQGCTFDELRLVHRVIGGATVELINESLSSGNLDVLMPFIQGLVHALIDANMQHVGLRFMSMLTKELLESMGFELPDSVEAMEAAGGVELTFTPPATAKGSKRGH